MFKGAGCKKHERKPYKVSKKSYKICLKVLNIKVGKKIYRINHRLY